MSPTNTRRRTLLTCSTALLVLTATLLLVWLGAHAFTSRSQWARMIAWLDSDVGDYRRFPYRVVENQGPAYNFQQPSEEMRQKYAPALETVSFAGAVHNLDEFLADTDTVAFLVIKDNLSMSSGIRYAEGFPERDDADTYYAPDLRAVAVSSPISGEPGQAFRYNNFHPLLLGLLLERAAGMPVAEYLEAKIWKPLGMEAPGFWSLDSQSSGFEKMESGINGRAIDFARFGQLYLNRGNWNGVQVIPAEWVDVSTRRDTSTDPAEDYQYFWWLNTTVPDHQYLAAGKHGQYIYIVPEQDLVMVGFGKTDPLHGGFRDVFAYLASQIAGAGE